MKKLIFIQLCFAICSTIMAQDFICRIDTVYNYEYIPGSELKILTGRVINTYNNNLHIEQTQQNFNHTNNLYSTVFITSFIYDSQSRLIEQTSANWNTSTNSWVGSQKKTIQYSQSAPQEIESQHQWFPSGWIGNYQYHRSYNANGELIELMTKIYNSSLQQWVNYQRVLWQFDANGNNNETSFQNWDVSNWNLVWRNTNSFDSEQKITQELRENWIQSSNSWVNTYRNNFTYNTNGKIIEKLYQTWDASISAFVNNQRTVYNYPSELDEISIVSNWNINLAFWQNLYRYTRLEDSQGNEIEKLFESWNNTQNNWVNVDFQKHFFDQNNFLIAREYFADWNITANYFDYRNRSEYLCSSLEVLTNESFERTEIFAYPNPIVKSETLYIRSQKPQGLIIINALGKTCFQSMLNEGINQISIDALKPGLYFLNTEDASLKLIVH